VALERRQVERAVDHHDLGLAQSGGEPFGGDEILAGGWTTISHDRFLRYANASRTRRFSLPFFSICVTRTAPISAVERTWVPPQGCRSKPAISISRTRPVPIGGFPDMGFTQPRFDSSSASLIQRPGTAPSFRILSASLAAVPS